MPANDAMLYVSYNAAHSCLALGYGGRDIVIPMPARGDGDIAVIKQGIRNSILEHVPQTRDEEEIKVQILFIKELPRG